MRRAPVLIVGGGPAGSAAAIELARAGRTPLVLERSIEPQDAICGGFLSWNTVRRLRELGVDPEALGAKPVGFVALFAQNRSSRAALPHASMSLSRRAMDAALIAAAESAGAKVERGVRVREVAEGRAVLDDAAELGCERLIVATGKHDVRGAPREQVSTDPALGLRWRLPPAARLEALIRGQVELHLFPGGYAGVSLQEDGSANVCMALRRSMLTAAGGSPADLLQRLAADHPALAARLDAGGGAPGRADAIANVPYGWILGEGDGPGLRVGDRSAVIPSLAGEGIAMALASGSAAARAVLAAQSDRSFRREWRARAQGPVRVSRAVRRIVESRSGAAAATIAAGVLPGIANFTARLSRID